MIPDAAVEAAARAMSPRVWGPQVWTFVAHGESPAAARERVQQESLADARRALEAAAPHMQSAAWEDREGAEGRVKSIVQDVAMTVDYTERLYAAVQEIMDITMPRTAK